MRDSGMQPRLKLSYPCEWPYVVIGRSELELRAAVREIVQERSHTVTLSNTSAHGRYISLKVLVVVHNDDDRVGIYHALNKHPATTVVI